MPYAQQLKASAHQHVRGWKIDSIDRFGDYGEGQVSKDLERYYRIAFEETDAAIIISDFRGQCIVANPSSLSLTGYSKEELVGMDVLDLFQVNDRVPSIERDSLPPGKSMVAEGRLRRKGGDFQWVELRIRKLPDGSFLETIHNITERKLADETLRKNEELFRIAFEHAPTGMSIVGPDGVTYLAVNPLLCEMFGYAKEEFLGKTIHLVTHPDDEALSDEWILKKFNNEPCEPYLEKRYIHKDGHIVWGLVSAHWIRNDDGSHRMAIAHIQDITDRKQAEEERRKLEGQVRQAQKMESIGLLAGGVAHDFNNLLTPILGYADILSLGLEEADERKMQLRQISLAAERAREVVQRLLAFSRKQVLELKTADLGDIIRKFETMLRRTIRENIEIHVKISPDLCPVKADPGQIEQVLLNLSINAQDAMPAGGHLLIEADNIHLDPDSPLRSRDIQPGDHVMISVRDSGEGMDEEVIKHIFEPFYTTKELGRGTGLGLSTAYGIIKQHNGTITASSVTGSGSTFRIFLPQVVLEGGEMPEEDFLPDAIAPGNETILVAEDNEMVMSLACDMLTQMGYTVLAAGNPERCIDLAKQHDGVIHLLLTDFIMPRMNGKELYDVLKKQQPSLKVIFMSGYASDLIGNQDFINRENSFIQKPFSLQKLSEIIRRTLDSEQAK